MRRTKTSLVTCPENLVPKKSGDNGLDRMRRSIRRLEEAKFDTSHDAHIGRRRRNVIDRIHVDKKT
ncbi:hypothetical protein [Pandoraea communis]|uniref:hypothetical protein n=1 Tax=Pandoraea communis TaxID=2508297 RepID=UPI001C2DC39B|nr:hypothetical protein [Pandoraea communis]